MPGPPRQPTNLRVFKGNPGRRPLPKGEPRPKVTAPSCPDWLDKEAKAAWRELVPQLLAVRCLTKQDRMTLAAVCNVWSRYRKAVEALRSGLTQDSAQGIIRRPESAIAAECERLIAALGDRLGLSPSARTRIDVGAGGDQADPILGW